MHRLIVLTLALLLSGCVSLVKDVVTAPIKIVSKTADVLTTSQSESDEKRGREMRQREETLGRLARQRDEASEKCQNGTEAACSKAAELNDRIAAGQDQPI
jgi:hypothetical protein